MAAHAPAPQVRRRRRRRGLWARLNRVVIPCRRKRGAALIVVLLTVAILTTVVLDFAYTSRVQLHMAANQRDEVKAYFLARAGFDLARLALGFQRQVDMLSGRKLNVQIWQYMEIFMGAFNAGKVNLPVADVDLGEVQGLGGIKGGFSVDVEPQDGKLNINALADASNKRARMETIARLSMLMFPGEHKDLFERKDSKGGYNDIPEIIAAIIDWVDADFDMTTMNADGAYLPTGPGQESTRYRGVGKKIKARNMKVDTLEELHLVKGVGDDFFERFADSLTIYPGTKINVNTANEQLLAVLICSHTVDPMDPLCSDPFNLIELWAIVAQIRMWQNLRRSIFMMTPFAKKSDFTGFLRRGRPEMGFEFTKPLRLNWSQLQKDIEVRPPAIYKITAEGTAGSTTKKLVAVIDLNKKGSLYYWREF